MSLKEHAYNIIKQKIILCELLPGQIIDEKALIDELNYSRTPIREALSILAEEGLVNIMPRRGIFVSDVTIRDIESIFIFKEEVEPIIIKLAIDNIPKEKLLYFRDLFVNFKELYNTDSKEKDYVIIDTEFHSLITQSCDNKYFIQTMNVVYNLSQRIRILTKDYGRMKESAKEHLEIIEFLLDKDVDNAVKAMRMHYINSRLNIMQFKNVNELLKR